MRRNTRVRGLVLVGNDISMIDVLLATYHPQTEMLKAQVESICSQRGVKVNLICRKDTNGLGASSNFSALLAESNAEYISFSDQDDVWKEDKLCKCLIRMHEIEAAYGRNVPLLVFCDGYVTDADLNPKPGTVMSRQGIDAEKGLCFNRLLMQNFVPGNAMLFNAALREKAGRVPVQALMHDAWLILVAAAFGRISFLNEPLYFYRQHKQNLIGATKSDWRYIARRVCEGHLAFRNRLLCNIYQAQAFVRRFGEESPDSASVLAKFPFIGWAERRVALVRHGLWKHGLFRNLALLAFS